MASGKIPRICENCGDPFRVYPSKVAEGKGRFCSRQCVNEAMVVGRIERPCLYCEALFERIPSEMNRSGQYSGQFCSQKCFHTWRIVPLAIRFQQFIGETTASGCILWTGGSNRDGRGVIATEPPGSRQISAPAAALLLAGSPVPKGKSALHHCDNPPCVNIEHLFIGTQVDNDRDMVTKRRHAHGERHAFAKLTEATVLEARERYGDGGIISFKDLALEYGVTAGAMGLAVTGRTWRHLSAQAHRPLV